MFKVVELKFVGLSTGNSVRLSCDGVLLTGSDQSVKHQGGAVWPRCGPQCS
ncbi:hypothetical protein DPMN_133048 [Dreissena polymorpha]|uniref:Uncharacterized protein n=1 Tax=Dreissena polymorpha TaxID=45954 RepID=A0A9D4FTJ1_DREPO|nr:hypothetical protein DPMN_133036 [Dreissena polymorpha]KAH3804760.1 hypothetical protein DPMN_133048 [Dreissena polymorpha]